MKRFVCEEIFFPEVPTKQTEWSNEVSSGCASLASGEQVGLAERLRPSCWALPSKYSVMDGMSHPLYAGLDAQRILCSSALQAQFSQAVV